MDSFASEMGPDGLLFLRSVRRVELNVDGDPTHEIEYLDGDSLVR
jgi:hypothetical protein